MSGRSTAETLAAAAIAAGLVGLGIAALTKTEIYRLTGLEPVTREKYKQLLARCRARGFEILTGSTVRSAAEQQKVYEAGTSSTTIGWHMVKRAIDAYPIVNGKPDYNTTRPDLYRIMHQEWARLGGHGLAYSPYPDGPVRLLVNREGKKYWDGGHLEFHGPYATALAAWKAENGTTA